MSAYVTNIGGVLHVSVTGVSGQVLQARQALRDELQSRQDAPLASQSWRHPVRVPELDTDDGNGLVTTAYRERLDTDEPVEVERARADLAQRRLAEHNAIRSLEHARDARQAASRRLNELLVETGR